MTNDNKLEVNADGIILLFDGNANETLEAFIITSRKVFRRIIVYAKLS